MSETCPKCGSPKLHPDNRYFSCEYDSCGQFPRPSKCVAVEIAALTQRAEQAEALVADWQKIEDELCKSLHAAESREKRLREGIEAAMRIKDLWAPSNDWSVEHAEEAKALEMMRFNFEFLLAQPSDGKEAEGGK